MRQRGRWIVEETQRDPAGGKLMLDAIVIPFGHGGVTGNTIGF